MLLDIVTSVAVYTIIFNHYPVRHVNAIMFAFCLAFSTSHAVQTFDDYTPHQRLEFNIRLSVLTVFQNKGRFAFTPCRSDSISFPSN